MQGSETAEQEAQRFKAGDPDAVRSVQVRVKRVLSFRGYGIPAEDRRDLEQEVMAQLWQYAGSKTFRTDVGFWGLVEVVVGRRCIDWLRTRRQTVELPEMAETSLKGPLAGLLAEERRELAYAALAQQGKSCRDVIYLHAVLGLPYGEVSQMLGKSEGALRVMVHRCVKRARVTLLELAGSDASRRQSQRQKRRKP